MTAQTPDLRGYIAYHDCLMGPIVMYVTRGGLTEIEKRCQTMMEARIQAGVWNREYGYNPPCMPGQFNGLTGLEGKTWWDEDPA